MFDYAFLLKKVVGLNASVLVDTTTSQTSTCSTFVDKFGLHVERDIVKLYYKTMRNLQWMAKQIRALRSCTFKMQSLPW